MTDPLSAAAAAVAQQATMIQAMREEGERRVRAFGERMGERHCGTPVRCVTMTPKSFIV